MQTLVLMLALLASNATAADAQKLAAAKQWDDLYLQFSSGDPGAFSARDRSAIAAALLQGAQGSEDAVISTSLAERAVAFHETVPALVFAAQLEEKVQQNAQAARFLDRAIALQPRSGPAHFARAELALSENDAALALQHVRAVPAKYQPAGVRALRRRAEAAQAEKQAGESALHRVEQQVAEHERHASDPVPQATGAGSGARVDPLAGAQLAGLRERAGAHFAFAYGNNERDWGQRAEYEGKVESALEEAYEFVGETLHANRTQPTAVVLYTSEEYAFHFGGSELSRAAGFYSGKIRINGAEELTPEVKAVIVHEYVHAVLDELMHGGQHCPVWVNEGFATYVENLYRDRRGMPGADDAWAQELRATAAANRLPKLTELNRGFLQYPNPRLAYATAGRAIRILVEHYGMKTFVDLAREVSTRPWGQAFPERMPTELSELDEEVRGELSQ